MNLVHYLIRHPSEHGLVYPTELDVEGYQTIGNFFLMGREEDSPSEEYIFYGIHGEEIVETTAIRYRDSKSFFRIEVENIGNFIFFSQPMPKKIPYIGSNENLRGLFAISRFRSWQPYVLDQVCRKHAFYFIGTSPRTQQGIIS